MTELPLAQKLLKAGTWQDPVAVCALSYEDRFFRRKKLTVDLGWCFVADLKTATSLDDGDGLELLDGRIVAIVAAAEPLLMVCGKDLARLAWHIGNRHTPCQVECDRLVIRNDPVIADMLSRLGASITPINEPFSPEGGAYGHGRTHSHEHGASAHAH